MHSPPRPVRGTGLIRGSITSSRCRAARNACARMRKRFSACCDRCSAAARRCWLSTWTIRFGAASWAIGAGGIRLGQGSGEGEAFLAFQRYAKDLSQRGIVLAVCSKNDLEKAREPFEKRADMVHGRHRRFVANWNNKADNLRSIAEQLELGLDSIVFVDDNPAERALVRRFVPQVSVPDLPDDPSPDTSPRWPVTATLRRRRVYREDSARARYYCENSRRKELAGARPIWNRFWRRCT